jgi:single-stranded DNA-specific DHH superfamily exonuclease
MTAFSGFSEKEMRKFQRFLETRGKRIVFYHTDADGVCSAALLLRNFPDLEYAPLEGPVLGKALLQGLKEAQPSLLIFLDPLPQEPYRRLLLHQLQAHHGLPCL